MHCFSTIDAIDCVSQVHWPDRYVPTFGSLCYDPAKERDNSVPIEETLGALKELIDAKKIRYYGLSNESTFGLCQWCRAADKIGAPYPVSVQNQFSLLYRTFESELAEACAPSNYNVALLPWTPLGGGVRSHLCRAPPLRVASAICLRAGPPALTPVAPQMICTHFVRTDAHKQVS